MAGKLRGCNTRNLGVGLMGVLGYPLNPGRFGCLARLGFQQLSILRVFMFGTEKRLPVGSFCRCRLRPYASLALHELNWRIDVRNPGKLLLGLEVGQGGRKKVEIGLGLVLCHAGRITFLNS